MKKLTTIVFALVLMLLPALSHADELDSLYKTLLDLSAQVAALANSQGSLAAASTAVAPAKLLVSPDFMFIGSVKAGTSVTKTLTVTNVSKVTTTAKIDAGGLIGPKTKVLAPGQTTTFSFKIAPTIQDFYNMQSFWMGTSPNLNTTVDITDVPSGIKQARVRIDGYITDQTPPVITSIPEISAGLAYIYGKGFGKKSSDVVNVYVYAETYDVFGTTVVGRFDPTDVAHLTKIPLYPWGGKTTTLLFTPSKHGLGAGRYSVVVEYPKGVFSAPSTMVIKMPVIYSPSITVEPDSLDFGTIRAGTNTTKNFSITNTGSRSVTVSMNGSDIFAIITGSSMRTIAPGASTTIPVQFYPMHASSTPLQFQMPIRDDSTGLILKSINLTGIAS